MKLLYFAWLRTKIGRSEEVVTLPTTVQTVADLVAWLKTRGPAFADALSHDAVVKVAVNQTYAKRDALVTDADEVALFPPVTGG